MFQHQSMQFRTHTHTHIVCNYCLAGGGDGGGGITCVHLYTCVAASIQPFVVLNVDKIQRIKTEIFIDVI